MSAAIHVLLVEDEPSLRTTLERALRLHRYDVTSFANGKKAQESFAAGRVDILLTDVSLSGEINGFALASWAREWCPRLPIALISGLELYNPPATIVADPLVRMLPKPFTMAALMSVLAELLAVV